MLTDLGKALRIIRVNRNICAKDMAVQLCISPSYLSAIENGMRNVPENFLSQLLSKYQLSEYEKELINTAIIVGDATTLDLSNVSEGQRKLLFAIMQSDLDDKTINELCKQLDLK